jgi:hypothetical protein
MDVNVWTMSLPVLSMAHVLETTEAALIASGDWMVASYDHGFFLYLEEDTDGLLVPDELVPILVWFDAWQKINNTAARWIRFDQWGDRTYSLPSYDW